MVGTPSPAWLAERARELGFVLCGVVRAEKFPELERQQEWLAHGYAGEMHYLGDTRRADLQLAMPGVRGVIICALTYNTPYPRTAQAWKNATATESVDREPRGWVSRYAWGDDYHEVMRVKLDRLLEKLRQEHTEPFESRIYADTGPINERVLAKRAGLGWLGKNTLLLNEQLGSYFFLGVIMTTLDLQPTLEALEFPPPDRCGTCTKCIEACPTNALLEPYVMDARRCISYLTIELRGAIPEALREPMGQHVFGCDICQDVCPWNRNAPITEAIEFQPRAFSRHFSEPEALRSLPSDEKEPVIGAKRSVDSQESLFKPGLEWLASLDENQFREMFRGSPIKRTKWRGLIRNACIALGNSRASMDLITRKRVFALLSRLAKSDQAVLAESAQWAISRIQESELQGVAPSPEPGRQAV
jgi:epoxyqueuosine reductase